MLSKKILQEIANELPNNCYLLIEDEDGEDREIERLIGFDDGTHMVLILKPARQDS